MINFEISIINNQDFFPIEENKIENTLQNFLSYIVNSEDILNNSVVDKNDFENKSVSVDIVFCGDEQIQELNLSYRGKDKPTDVLSFALYADSDESELFDSPEISLGEVIISTETANRQAEENGKTFEEEVNFLLSHGILHLFGIDHPDESSLEKMLSYQSLMLSQL